MDSLPSSRRSNRAPATGVAGGMSKRATRSSSQSRHLAYKLGYLSQFNIQKEASRTAPQLHRLIGHAAIFDSAARFITEHMNDERPVVQPANSTLDEDFDDLPSLNEIEDVDDNSIESPKLVTFNHYRQFQRKEQYIVVVTTSEIDNPERLLEDAESDSSTEAGDLSDDDDWSDSTCEGGNEDERPDRKFMDIPLIQTGDDLILDQVSYDDDLLLWSQQPRILSPQQAENLLVEAFG